MHLLKGVLVAGVMLAFAACVNKGEIEEIKTNQKEILAKLEEIGKARPAPSQPRRPRGPDPTAVYAFPIGKSYIKGPTDAWVTVVEVSDFQCPFCKRVGPTLKKIEETYDSDVRFVFKHNPLPFHNRALPAAQAAECMGEQGKFFEMHDKLFENQRALEDADLAKYAAEIGSDKGSWKSCVDGSKYKSKIDADQRQAAQLGARGTPAFFINGRFLSGAQPFEAFKTIIDEELKKAQASGIAKGDYYAKAVEQKGKKAL